MTASPIVDGFWDKSTGSWQRVFHDPATMQGAIVDPVLTFDPRAGAMPTAFVPRSSGTASIELGFTTPIRTLSAAPFLQEMLGPRTNIGGHVVKVQKLWQEIYNLIDLPTNGSQ